MFEACCRHAAPGGRGWICASDNGEGVMLLYITIMSAPIPLYGARLHSHAKHVAQNRHVHVTMVSI
jgi:hypothetical protein